MTSTTLFVLMRAVLDVRPHGSEELCNALPVGAWPTEAMACAALIEELSAWHAEVFNVERRAFFAADGLHGLSRNGYDLGAIMFARSGALACVQMLEMPEVQRYMMSSRIWFAIGQFDDHARRRHSPFLMSRCAYVTTVPVHAAFETTASAFMSDDRPRPQR